MASIETEGLPLAAPATDPWPRTELGDYSALGLQADEMFARKLDTGFAGAAHDSATGHMGRHPEDALAGIAETIPLLGALKDLYLAQAQGPRQRAIVESLNNSRLYHARAASAGSLRRCRLRPPEWRPTERSTKPRDCMR